MFNALWKMREGFVTGAGLILVGLLLQYTAGPIDWSAFAFPLNAIVLALYLLLLIIIYALRHRVRLFSFLFTVEAAVPTLIYAAILTVAMGLTRQVAPHERAIDPIGLTRMLSFWPFVLIYARLAGIVGLIAIRQILHFRLREVPSLLSHIGLFIAIVAATLGSADMERVKLKATTDMPEWRATHDQGFMELPLAIQLEKFTIDEYPPPSSSSSIVRQGSPYQRRTHRSSLSISTSRKACCRSGASVYTRTIPSLLPSSRPTRRSTWSGAHRAL